MKFPSSSKMPVFHIVAAMALSSCALAEGNSQEPLCGLIEKEDQRFAAFSAELVASAPGLEEHSNQEEVKTFLKNHLSCMRNFTDGAKKQCAIFVQNESSGSAPSLPQNISGGGTAIACSYYANLLGIARQSKKPLDAKIIQLNNLFPVYQRCANILSKNGNALAKQIAHEEKKKNFPQAIYKINALAQSVKQSDEMQREIDRIVQERSELEKTIRKLSKKYDECLVKNKPTTPVKANKLRFR